MHPARPVFAISVAVIRDALTWKLIEREISKGQKKRQISDGIELTNTVRHGDLGARL